MLPDLLVRLMSDPRCLWSMGGPGAALALRGSAVGTAGALRLRPHPLLRLIAFEVLSADPESWNHAIALCLPAGELLACGATGDIWSSPDAGSRSSRSGTVTEAVTCSRQIRLFLRERCDSSDWIAQGPLGLIEVWDQIGPPPLGPVRRTHPATSPIPTGLVAFAHVVPAHPVRCAPGRPKDFDSADHRAFQAILSDHGRTELVALKASVRAAIREGRNLPLAPGRHAQTQLRVALRQERQIAPSAHLDRLIARYDLALARHLGLPSADCRSDP